MKQIRQVLGWSWFVATTASVLPAVAQDVPIPGRAGRGFVFCRWGDTAAACDAWPIVELGGNVTVVGPRRLPYLTVEGGAVFPITRGLAAGGSLFLGGGEGGYVVALKPRARLWVGRALALDLAPGLVFDATDIEPPDWLVSIGVSWRDHVGLVVQLDLLERYTGNRFVDPLLHDPVRVAEDLERQTSWHIGVRFGLGPIVAAGR